MKNKICTKCKIEKELSEFHKNNQQSSELNCWCKTCMKIYIRAHYLKNRERILARQIKYRKANLHTVAKSRRKYYKNNKIKIIKNNKEYERQRLKKDINFRILKNLRARTYLAIKNGNKSSSIKILLGCSLKVLKQHLESQFKRRMNWDNYGRGINGKSMKEWHIDHIRPCASFDLSKQSEQNKCFHYTNLQPLWAKDNLSKGNKI